MKQLPISGGKASSDSIPNIAAYICRRRLRSEFGILIRVSDILGHCIFPLNNKQGSAELAIATGIDDLTGGTAATPT